uniref:Adaptor related protein complex 1 subunit sigma 1 n=2 Tax=Oncorhynchus tshawytscha TaxID=74940 RepID=A0A8C8ES74_ONCTS
MMRFMLLFSRQGKLRLQKWYTATAERDKKKMVRELMQVVLARKPKMSSFLEWRDLKIVYKRYASLYFCCAVEEQDNELITLEVIHRFVELLDKYFGSVSHSSSLSQPSRCFFTLSFALSLLLYIFITLYFPILSSLSFSSLTLLHHLLFYCQLSLIPLSCSQPYRFFCSLLWPNASPGSVPLSWLCAPLLALCPSLGSVHLSSLCAPLLLQIIPHNDKSKRVSQIFCNLFHTKKKWKYHIYISIQTLYSVLC